MAHALRHEGQAMTASGLDVLAGIWLLISPFVLAFSSTLHSAMVNNVIFGIIIGLLALFRFFNPSNGVVVSWINVILGIWVLISPWVLGFGMDRVPTTNNVIMGIIVIILAGWSAFATGDNNQMDRPVV